MKNSSKFVVENETDFFRMKQKIENQGKNETTKTLKDYDFFIENPFIDSVIDHIETINYRKVAGSKIQQVLNHETGELENQKLLVLGEQRKVDSQQFYKLFYGSIKAFFDLSKGTMKLFEYIMEQIGYGKDKICLSSADVEEKTSLSRTAVYRSILQLLNAGILARTNREGCFFINPTIAFKGDRITLVKQYILEKGKKSKSLPKPTTNATLTT